jgi:hypothetical protein
MFYFNSQIQKIPKNKPQCYDAAEQMFQAFNFGKKITEKKQNILAVNTLKHLYDVKPSITTIELNIISSDIKRTSNMKLSKFWIPRIFNHSFNVLIIKDKIFIAQSWFRYANYRVIYEFTNTKEFIEWLDQFKSMLKNYNKNPRALFKLFKYNKNLPLFNIIKNNVKTFKIQSLVKYHLFE